jgi:hypothetical protein
MARTGPSGFCCFPLRILLSAPTAHTTFEPFSGAVVRPAVEHAAPTNTGEELEDTALRARLRARCEMLRRVSTVWLVEMTGTPDAALLDIDLEVVKQEIAAQAIRDATDGTPILSSKKSDLQLSRTPPERRTRKVHLLTTAMNSILLSDVEEDETARMQIFEQLLEYLLDSNIDRLPANDQELLGQIREATLAKALTASDNMPPHLRLLTELQSVPIVPLAERRCHSTLSLGGLPDSVIRADDRVWSLFYHRVLEDPDFPKLPLWSMDYPLQRKRVDFVSQLSEEHSPDFFAHATFVENILYELDCDGMSLSTQDVMAVQEESMSHYENELMYETMAARDEEEDRLLRGKIEHILPAFKRLQKENEVLPYIKLEVLEAAGFSELSDAMCKIVLRREMRKLTREDKLLVELSKTKGDCIRDLDVEYPDGSLRVDAFPSMSSQKVCSKEFSDSIKMWAEKTEAPQQYHIELYDSKGDAIRNLEPTYNAEFAGGATEKGASYPSWSSEGSMIDFTYFGEELPLLAPSKKTADYDDMSLPSYSKNRKSEDSSAGEGSEELNSASPPTEATNSREKQVVTDYDDHEDNLVDQTHQVLKEMIFDHEDVFVGGMVDATHDIFGNGATIHKDQDASKIYNERCAKNSRIGTTTISKLAAVREGKHLGIRRYNSLHMAWDVPHQAHGPEQAGYRNAMRLRTRPTPDWDAPSVEKPTFAHGKKSEKLGLLDAYNAEKDAEERARKNYVEEVTTSEVDIPPRRPIYEGAASLIFERTPKQPASQQEKSSWEKGTLGATGIIISRDEEPTSTSLYGFHTDQSVFGYGGVNISWGDSSKDFRTNPVTPPYQTYEDMRSLHRSTPRRRT